MVIKDRGGSGLPLSLYPYIIVSVDPGETTGIAAYQLATRDLRCTSTENIHSLFPLLALLKPAEILLEAFPDRRTLEYEIEAAYNKLATKSIVIHPGEWKPFMKAHKKKIPQAKTQHEKDAVNMLRYYLLITRDSDI